jgi:hypothetical protein
MDMLYRIGRWLSGDWWMIETNGNLWGVCHPWREHRWKNYRLTKEDAKKEQWRLNSGREYVMCKECGFTHASHKNGIDRAIECP